jgi:hypothetical protein
MPANIRILPSAVVLALIVACGGGPTGSDSAPSPSASKTPLVVCNLLPYPTTFGMGTLDHAIDPANRVWSVDMAGQEVVLAAPGQIRVRLSWVPSDASVDLYIMKNTGRLTCAPGAPCENYLAADLDPTRQPKELMSQQLEPDSYIVWTRNRSPVTITLTSGEISICNTY